MPNDDLRANPHITVTDELDSADAPVISDGLRDCEPPGLTRYYMMKRL